MKKLPKPVLALMAVLPLGYLLAAGPATTTHAAIFAQQSAAGVRTPGDVNGDKVLDSLDLTHIQAVIDGGDYYGPADLDSNDSVDDRDTALAILMLAGRKSVQLLVADSNFDGVVDGGDAQRFLRLYGLGSSLVNFTRQQDPEAGAADSVDDKDVEAWVKWFELQTAQ